MSKIEWTEQTWNPIVGCSIVSPGCTNCYAMKMAARIEAMGVPHYAGLTKPSKAGAVWTGKLALAPNKILLEPLRRKKPTTYFVNSMGDLFHEDVPDEWIDRVFAVMALTPQHTYQVLTKRSARMREYVASTPDRAAACKASLVIEWDDRERVLGVLRSDYVGARSWPLQNVWLGVSAERQQEADERIPGLLATPASVRFVSAEPLLGPIDFAGALYHDTVGISMRGYLPNRAEADDYHFHSPKLDWIIVGGESGPGARPMNPDWARSIRDQCTAAGVAFFFKQWGEWAPYDRSRIDGSLLATPNSLDEPIQRFGKRLAGRLLDGREHSDMPSINEMA